MTPTEESRDVSNDVDIMRPVSVYEQRRMLPRKRFCVFSRDKINEFACSSSTIPMKVSRNFPKESRDFDKPPLVPFRLWLDEESDQNFDTSRRLINALQRNELMLPSLSSGSESGSSTPKIRPKMLIQKRTTSPKAVKSTTAKGFSHTPISTISRPREISPQGIHQNLMREESQIAEGLIVGRSLFQKDSRDLYKNIELQHLVEEITGAQDVAEQPQSTERTPAPDYLYIPEL